ncbi:hypothetical protein AX16_001441 [Volvariella volvacea WC 439]|nr:hypothetical protein AX16_001441 [Volvariella volvacea WC 439]
MWTEHRNPEGRTYWFNTSTKESVWEKPDELKTPFERALNQTKWKEYFSNGRKYYYNTDTKESKWDMPDELLLLLEKVEKESKPGAQAATVGGPARITGPGLTPLGGANQGAIVPIGGAEASSSNPASQSTQNGTQLAIGAHTGALPMTPSGILPARPNLPDDPVIPHNGFATLEEGEKAFTHLLKKAGVDATWTWDQTMRAIITDPLYKALNTLAEKKACWEKYTNGLRAKEQQEKEERLARLRPAIRNMLKGNPNVFHYTTFPTADKLFAQHPIWQQARIEAERRLIFEEYVAELKQREVQETRTARARSVSKVVSLFKQLNVDVTTRWKTAHSLVTESEEWNVDPELRKLPTLDILLAFEDYSRVREREFEDQMRKAQVEKTREERKAREAFKELLQGLVQEQKIVARSKWKEVYPLFKDDERYLKMLGKPGSNPLELFWDAVDALDQQLDAKIVVIEEVIKQYNSSLPSTSSSQTEDGESKEKGFSVGIETTFEEFSKIVQDSATDIAVQLSPEDFRQVFESLRDQAAKRLAEEKRKAERRQRHLQDDLRYALKKLPEALDVNLTYEQAVPFMEHLPEYKALEDEEGKRAAFAKFVKRQKERLREAGSEDGGSVTSRKRKEPPRDYREAERDKERDREKDKDKDKERERERERDRDKDRDAHRDRDRERDRERERDRDRGKEYDRDGRGRHHHRYEEYDSHGHRSSREYGRERDREEKDREYRSKHSHYRDDKDDRRRERDRERKGTRSEYDGHGRDWEDWKYERERSVSTYPEDSKDRRDHEDRLQDERSEKRPRYDRDEDDDAMDVDKQGPIVPPRAETPEEGEI